METLIKGIVHESGALSTHWRVAEVSVSFIRRTAIVVMAGWTSADALASGRPPLDAKRLDASGPAFDRYFGEVASKPVAELALEVAAEHALWSGAGRS